MVSLSEMFAASNTRAGATDDTEQIQVTVSFLDGFPFANSAHAVAYKTHCSSSGYYEQIEELPVYRTFAEFGEQYTHGGADHPYTCTPCAFYCFRKKGCPSGEHCDFCHMEHESKSRNRREAWKQGRAKRCKARHTAKGNGNNASNEDDIDGVSELTVVSASPPQQAVLSGPQAFFRLPYPSEGAATCLSTGSFAGSAAGSVQLPPSQWPVNAASCLQETHPRVQKMLCDEYRDFMEGLEALLRADPCNFSVDDVQVPRSMCHQDDGQHQELAYEVGERLRRLQVSLLYNGQMIHL